MNINSKERENTTKSTSTRRRKRSQETSGSARGKASLHKGLPVVKTIYTYGFHELFLNLSMTDYVIDRRGLCFISKQYMHMASMNYFDSNM
jgi:hypothetical protein